MVPTATLSRLYTVGVYGLHIGLTKSSQYPNCNRKNPKILIIPPQMWFKFKSTAESSTIINFIDNAHDIKETEKKPLKSANKYKY